MRKTKQAFPPGQAETSVVSELTLGHQRCRLAGLPSKPNSPVLTWFLYTASMHRDAHCCDECSPTVKERKWHAYKAETGQGNTALSHPSTLDPPNKKTSFRSHGGIALPIGQLQPRYRHKFDTPAAPAPPAPQDLRTFESGTSHRSSFKVSFPT